MARQIDRAAGRDLAMVALVIGAAPTRTGYALPSAPVAVDQGKAAARRYHARLFARVHIHRQSDAVRNLMMDVITVDGLKTVFSRAYPYDPRADLPPLRSATIDLVTAAELKLPSGDLLADAPFVETRTPAALEAFLGYLDNTTLAVAARGRPVGASFRPPAELLDEALSADPGFETARVLKRQGALARFDRVLVAEIPLQE
jgi:hypothetical protein